MFEHTSIFCYCVVMVEINKETIESVSKLVRISFNEYEAEQYSKQLAEVVAYVDQLAETVSGDIKPLAQISGLKNVMREDKVTNSEMTTDLLKNAPMSERGYLKVKVIK